MAKLLVFIVLLGSHTSFASLQIFKNLLASQKLKETKDFLKKMPYSDLMFADRYIDPATTVEIEFYCPVLEVILQAMYKVWLRNSDDEGRTSHIDRLNEKVKTADFEKFKFLLEVRNFFLERYQLFLWNIITIENLRPSSIQNLFYYLESDEPFFKMLNGYQGRQKIFDEIMLREVSVRCQLVWLMFLCQYIKPEQLPSLKRPFLFDILTENGDEDEKKLLSIFRYLLYSKQFSSEELVRDLQAKDVHGQTALGEAARWGLIKVFDLFSSFLKSNNNFYPEDHAPAYLLTEKLLLGLKARIRRFEMAKDSYQAEILSLEEELKKPRMPDLVSLEIKDSMKKVMDLLKSDLAVVSHKKDVLKEKYRPAFSQVIAFWQNKYPFAEAPLSIQIAYLRSQLEYLSEQLIKEPDFPLLDGHLVYWQLVEPFSFLQTSRHEVEFVAIYENKASVYEQTMDFLL